MINTTIYRYEMSDQGTKSRFYTDIGFMCKMIELPWRENERNISCIPEGSYEVVPYKSSKFGQCYYVKDVEDRSGILIHSGNFAGDRNLGWQTHSYGCILPGQFFGRFENKYGTTQKAILNSRFTLNMMISYLEREPFILNIEKSIYYREI